MPESLQRWAPYFAQRPLYQQMVLVAALIGAIENLQGWSMTDEGIIEYFEEILFYEQTRTRSEPS